MLEWLLAPIDPGRAHAVDFAISWHGRLMVLGWGVLAPLGVLVARFLKVTPRQNWPVQSDNQFWWISHRTAQYTAFVLTAIGIILIVRANPTASTTPSLWLHQLMGWTITGFGAAQITSGWLRGSKGGPTDPAGLRGDHYDMTRRRIIFERFHKIMGYSVLTVAALTILSGMWQANAPGWMWIVVLGWWAALITVACVLQKKGMAMGSYQAIWGPDQRHPGNLSAGE